jgi:hypothetical protein
MIAYVAENENRSVYGKRGKGAAGHSSRDFRSRPKAGGSSPALDRRRKPSLIGVLPARRGGKLF